MKRFVLVWALGLVMLILCPAQGMAREVTLNFKDADIRAFIEFVAGFSGKNFLVDNRVKGKVTIISPTPVSEDAAYAIFLSVLEVNGFAAVDSGSVIKIVPRAEAKQKPLPVESGTSPPTAIERGDGMVTEVIPLKYADASQLMAILRPLVPPNSNLSVYPNGNMLLMTDSAANIERIRKVVKLLDRNEAVGVKVFTLQHASADKVAQALTQLYGGPGKGAIGSVKAMAYQPGNMLIVVAAPQHINEVIRMVNRLDISPPSDSQRLYVRYLKNANAEDVAKVITSLVSGQSAKGAAGGGAPGRALFSGEVKVVADPATNALLITADPADRPGLDSLIDKMDIRRLQVLVEALIIEITANGAQQFGMEFRGLTDPTVNANRKVIGGTTFSSQAGTNINTLAANPLSPGNGIAVGVVQGTITFGGNTYFNLGSLLRALETKTDTNVLSTPDILTMDNEEAEIIVGQNVPFITGTSSSTGTANPNPFNTVQRKDVGLTLRVTPQISEGDTIRLKIFQEISSVAPTPANVNASDIITNKRSIKTTVLANDGSIIVLGGLMRDDNTEGVQRVPCIGAIPLLGEPFKFTENTRTKTNLMVFLKPHIIRSRKDIETLTEEKYREVQGAYDKQKYEGTILFPQKKTPMPKEMNPLHPPAGKAKGKAPAVKDKNNPGKTAAPATGKTVAPAGKTAPAKPQTMPVKP